MNNILTFEDYKKMNIRQVESVIYRQFIEENIKEESIVNEGIIRSIINKISGKFIQNALADEIEKGKELEKNIKDALDGLNKGFEEIEKKINTDEDSKSKLTTIEKVKEAIKAAQSQTFDTLTMIGSEGEIDFAGFMGSATVAAACNFGILFSPVRSIFMTRKAYKYFLGIIKQTIRRNLLVIQLNFDQFENLILQKSFESEEDSEFMTKVDTLSHVITSLTNDLCDGKNQLFKGTKNKVLKDRIAAFKTAQDTLYKQHQVSSKNNPFTSLWQDQHNNTYTRTLEQIKQYINDDSQKELDALKNSISKMAGNDPDLMPYGELLITAAEEYAIHTNHGINNNFIKMSSVFNLDNQKKLIDLIVSAQKENEDEITKQKEKLKLEKLEEELENDISEGKKLYEKKIKETTESFTFDTFHSNFDSNEIKCLSIFFASKDGEEAYKELVEKNPLYKYLLTNDILSLNNFISSINDLKVIEVSEMDDFYSSIVNKGQTLYYMMAEKSIKNAIKSIKPEDYFGFKNITEDDVNKKNILISDEKQNILLDSIIGIKTIETKDKKTRKVPKTKYFLTFNGSGSGLFDILHNDFKTTIFNDDGNDYASEISSDSKQDIIKIIHNNFKLGNSITSQFAEYLVRLEAHMLLKEQDPWFVAKDNAILFEQCFETNSDKILNKNAFVEIEPDDYEDIKNFLTKYHSLSDKDFDMSEEKVEENK